jgi:hypothetical protein
MTQVCNVGLAQPDEEIHAATNRVHGWWFGAVALDARPRISSAAHERRG